MREIDVLVTALVEGYTMTISFECRDRESKERPPIGRFGIGKLASYVLANQLTHITKVNGVFRAVTMDFHEVEKDKTTDQHTVKLPIRELTEAEAKELLSPLLSKMGAAGEVLRLFGKGAAPTWTVAAMSDFKALAHTMKMGIVKRVLATALPMSPAFELFFNGSRLKSPKEAVPPLKTWIVGREDEVAVKKELRLLPTPRELKFPGWERYAASLKFTPTLLSVERLRNGGIVTESSLRFAEESSTFTTHCSVCQPSRMGLFLDSGW